MPRSTLREKVRLLRQEVDSGDPLSPDQMRILQDALREIEPLLESDVDDPEDPSLSDRLREAEAHFEETHPNLTMAIGAVADALSRLGI